MRNRNIVVGAHFGLGAALLAAGLLGAGATRREEAEDIVICGGDDPVYGYEPPRRQVMPAAPSEPTKHDLARIEAAERKRARKATRRAALEQGNG